MMRLNKNILVFLLILFIVTACSTPELPTNTPNQPNKPDLTNSEIKYSESELRAFSECWIQDNNAVYGEFLENKSCTALARLLTTAPGYGIDPNNNKAYGGLEFIKIQINKGIAYSLLVNDNESVKPCDNLVLFRKGDDPIGHTVVVFYVDLSNDILYYIDQNYAGMGITLRSLIISTEGKYAYIIPSTCRKIIDYGKCSPIIDAQTVDIANPSPDVEIISTQKVISIAGWKLSYDPEKWKTYEKILPDNPLCPWNDCSNTLTSITEVDCILQASLSEGYLDTHRLEDSTKEIGGRNIQILTTFDTNTNKIIHIRFFNPDNYPDSCIGTPWGYTKISESCIEKFEELIEDSLIQKQ